MKIGEFIKSMDYDTKVKIVKNNEEVFIGDLGWIPYMIYKEYKHYYIISMRAEGEFILIEID